MYSQDSGKETQSSPGMAPDRWLVIGEKVPQAVETKSTVLGL